MASRAGMNLFLFNDRSMLLYSHFNLKKTIRVKNYLKYQFSHLKNILKQHYFKSGTNKLIL